MGQFKSDDNPKMSFKFMTYFLLVFMFSSIFGEYTEHDLRKELFKDYNRNIRPVLNHSDAVELRLGMTLQQLMEVDEEQGTLKTSVWMNYNWQDRFLTWNHTVYPMDDIRVSVDDIWTPDLEVYNSNKSPELTANDKTRVVLSSNGDVTWVPPYQLTTACKFDMHWFPFDEQTCVIKMGSWTYNGFKLNLNMMSYDEYYDDESYEENMDLSTFVKNDEWELLGAPCKRNEVIYECCPEPYLDLSCEIKIRRRASKYWGTYINPQFLTSFICIMSGFISASVPVPRLTFKFLMIVLFILSIPKKLPQTSMFTNFITGNNYLLILSSLIFDAILITLHSRTNGVKDKCDTKNENKKSKKILMIADITIAIIFLIAYFANVIATFVSMPLIVG